jgi:hypothetical protein
MQQNIVLRHLCKLFPVEIHKSCDQLWFQRWAVGQADVMPALLCPAGLVSLKDAVYRLLWEYELFSAVAVDNLFF